MRENCLVLSIPHNGTHFAVWLLRDIFNLDARFQHFSHQTEERLREILSHLDTEFPIIVPVRPRAKVKQSWVSRDEKLSDLELSYNVRDRLREEFPDHNWIGLQVDLHDNTERFHELYYLAERLNRGAYTPEGFDWAAKNWPVIRTGGSFPMHKYAVKHWGHNDDWAEGEEDV